MQISNQTRRSVSCAGVVCVRVCPLTGVVVFCTVAQLLLFLHDELRQREPI